VASRLFSRGSYKYGLEKDVIIAVNKIEPVMRATLRLHFILVMKRLNNMEISVWS
jgi:hypothetical protein